MTRSDELYSHLIPTLGPRIAPSLFARLEAAAERGDFRLLNSIVTGIVALDSGEIVGRAAALLVHPSPLVQRAAMRVLARKPTPAVLDRLWSLHCTRNADPKRFLREHEYPTAAYEDTFSALRACAALNPAWLEGAIHRADPATEPVQDLAYLVAGVEDGGELWRRCKPALYEKVPTLHERSLAANIHKYRDADEVAWLLERIGRADNLVGPMALRALIRLDADLALQHLDQLPDRELYLARDWCLAELLARLPDATRAHLLVRLRGHNDPWNLALVFQGRENAVDVPILELLLDALSTRLGEELRHPSSPEQIGRVVLPFDLLLPMGRPQLLDCIRRRRGSPLEQNLVAWLLARGPQQGSWREHEKHDGLRVLAKIGGEGLTAVVNRWLEVGDRYGRMDALQLAAHRPDAATIGLLVRISQAEELRDDFPVEQGYAAKALAAAGRWSDVVAYIIRWGLRTLSQACTARPSCSRRSPDSPPPLKAGMGSFLTGTTTPLTLCSSFSIPLLIVRVRPPDRVLDSRGVIPPKGGHYHGPWQNAGRAEGTAVATLDRPVADQRTERAGLL
jgi:hypothetical protein